MNIAKVYWTKAVDRQLQKVPIHIQNKFRAWAMAVEEEGIYRVRMQPGFHDEPLKGKREGQRSIRLNRAYRAIYILKNSYEIELIEVIEVNKHEY